MMTQRHTHCFAAASLKKGGGADFKEEGKKGENQ
jgi:hypothetical protein